MLRTVRAGLSGLRLAPLLAAALASRRAFRKARAKHSPRTAAATAVTPVTLLFTDLHGSTDLYERLGDLRAYSLVRGHFARLQDRITDNGGVLVKTIGDAAMAAFDRPAPALRAALRMVREVTGDGLSVRVGVHAGLCIAVEGGGRRDYFGHAVNIAARVQGEARPGEIVATRTVMEAPGAANVLAAAGLRSRAETVFLKGVRAPITLFRLSPGRARR